MRRSDKLCYHLEGSNDAYTLARPLFGASERAFLIGRVKVRLGADAGEILLTLNCGAVRVCWPSATSPRTPVHAATYAGGFGLQGAPPQGQRDLAVRINVLYGAGGFAGSDKRPRALGQARETGACCTDTVACRRGVRARGDLTGIVQGTTLVIKERKTRAKFVSASCTVLPR
jgi:hypothetical protein